MVKMQHWVFIVSLILLCANYINCEDEDPNELKYDQESASLVQKLFKSQNYDHLVRPCGPNSNDSACTPAEITANMKILSITSVDDELMHLNMLFLLRQTWNDQRLKHEGQSDLVVDTSEKEHRVWTPDTFFIQEKDTFKPLTEQASSQCQISPDGVVQYSTRVAITLSCPMNLRSYPMDTQYCNVQFGSYAQTKEHVHYKWNENRGVELAADLSQTTPTFTLLGVTKQECKHLWVTGAYSCLKAEIKFQRKFGFGALMKNFIPSFVLVVLSWLAFYLGSDAIGIRALLGAGCLQFLLIHWSILSLNLPHVSGCRTIDIWFIACIIFVILSLVQLIFVLRCPATRRRTVHDVELLPLDRSYYADEPQPQPKLSKAISRGASDVAAEQPSRRPEAPGRRTSVIKVQRKYTRVAGSAPQSPPTITETQAMPMIPTSQYYEEPIKATKKETGMTRFRKLSGREKADVVARILFPVLFTIFNLAFWGAY